ncbi:MAG: hypothetical protein AAGK33_11110 [Pseudomonadota bacterium]
MRQDITIDPKLLTSFGGLGIVIALVVTVAVQALMPPKVSHGLVKDTALVFFGDTYASHVQCAETGETDPSLLKAFLGIHYGKRIFVKGLNRTDAQTALESTFEGCTTTALTRESKALWRKFI